MPKEIDPLGQVVTDYLDVIEGKKPAGEATIGGEQELTNEQRRRLPYVLAMQQPCLLCGGDAAVANYWKVPDSIEWEYAERRIFFTLCQTCLDFASWQKRVSDEMLLRIRAGVH